MNNFNIFEIPFKDKFIRSMFINWYYLRLDSITLFEAITDSARFSYKPEYALENPKENHDILYQFQCLLTSTDTKVRIIRNESNQQYGIMQDKDRGFVSKQEIGQDVVLEKLGGQITEVAEVLKEMPMPEDTRELLLLWSLINHESMHQGQLVVMFREAGIQFPEDFAQKWDL